MTMKIFHFTKNNAGFGLIEVLVTTVVVGVGLLAVAALQGNLIGDSRTNKTRSEAKALADTKMEQLRDTIETVDSSTDSTGTGFDALASSSTAESIGGVTETFTRSWVVTNQVFDKTNKTWVPATLNATTKILEATTPTTGHTYGPAKKGINVTVCWDDCTNENKVVVQSVIAFDGVGNSVLAAEGAGAAATTVSGPSTNAESSDDITESITLSTEGTTGQKVTVNNKTYIVQNNTLKASRAETCASYSPALVAFENGLYTRRVDHDGVTGNEAIELYEKVEVSGVNYCIPRIRFNGGVIIPIRGIVHSGATSGGVLLDVELFTFNTSESGTYCVFNPAVGAKSAPYVCYVGGNCTGFSGTASTDVTACPGSISAAKVGPGGWRGKVGLLGIASNVNNVCFAEELAGSAASVDTARGYYTRINSINEGINKPYNCHDFLIINGQTTNAKIHNECVTQANAIAGLHLASKYIQRTISSGTTVFDPTIDTTYCAVTGTAYTISGPITNAASVPVVTVTDLVSTNNCTATNTAYSCQITTSATSVKMSGTYNNQTVNCTLTPVSSSGCTLTFTATANPTYTITGTISGTKTAANAVTLSISNGGVCINNKDYDINGTYNTYTCTLTTPATTASATLTPTTSIGGSVTPSTAQTITLPGTTQTLTGTAFSASMAATYTVSGTISIGNNVAITTATVAVDTGTGTCTLTGTHAQNTTDTYSCTVVAGANHLSVAISPACSTGGASKKHELTDGTTTTSGTGGLLINLGTVTSNISKNITVTKTNTNC
jgi:prepilin-type N-terminal cleavage/methylation domain-containing protein